MCISVLLVCTHDASVSLCARVPALVDLSVAMSGRGGEYICVGISLYTCAPVALTAVSSPSCTSLGWLSLLT